MNYNNTDIIIARATPVGKSALAVVRLSGANLKKIISIFFPQKKFKPNVMSRQTIKTINTKVVLDSCMVTFYQAPKSFTGEDMLEIFCHGNDIVVENIINEFIGCNIRGAYPGEFSYRAFKNNKIDLLQAESIVAKINQNSSMFSSVLENLESGSTSKQLNVLRKKIINIQSIVEYELDFNEDEITHINMDDIKKVVIDLLFKIEQILTYSLQLQRIERGYKLILLGRPNVGKSTLFNQLVGIDKAIVTEIKGTTRDVLESSIYIKGVPFILYDTAGYRKTKDKIESLGVNRALKQAKEADIIFMLDEKKPKSEFNLFTKRFPFLKQKKVVFIKSKCDKTKFISSQGVLSISCKNGRGINKLLTELLTVVGFDFEVDLSNHIVLCNERQVDLLKKIKLVFDGVLNDLNVGLEMDIVASQIRKGSDLFEELLGKLTSDEILNNIFKGFCVGK